MARNIPKAFADRLRQLRAQRHWTQDDLAERAGLSSDSIRRMETQRMSPTLTTLHRLAVGFGIDLATLLDGVGRKRRSGDTHGQLADYMATRTERETAALLRVAHALFEQTPP